MADVQRSPTHAPEYSRHREVRDAVDTLPETDQRHGMNMSGYLFAHAQVLPSGGANPSIEAQVWSGELGRFISLSPAETRTGAGADTPYELTFACRSRIIFVAVTGGVAGGQSVDVLVAGSELDHLR